MSLAQVVFRSIQPGDKEQMIALHQEFFPIPYSMSFYDKMIENKGMSDGELFSVIAEDSSGQIVGFILAQLLLYPGQCEDQGLFSSPEPETACYILTFGCIREYRRRGLGTALLEQVKQYALSHPTCGAVYLHVIHYNTAAIRFYEHNNFEKLRLLEDFYHIQGKYYSAYLYIHYLSSYHPSFFYKLYKGFRDLAVNGTGFLYRLVSSLSAFSPLGFAPKPSLNFPLALPASSSRDKEENNHV